MAILFTSPKRNQQIMIRVSLVVLIILLLGVTVILLPSQSLVIISSTSIAPNNTATVKINFEVLDSNQFKNLEPFSGTQTEFSYIATDKDGKKIVGSMVAETKDAVKKILEQMEFKVSSIEEKNIGRLEPFSPYY